jgi:hypothetical protein
MCSAIILAPLLFDEQYIRSVGIPQVETQTWGITPLSVMGGFSIRGIRCRQKFQIELYRLGRLCNPGMQHMAPYFP